MAKAAKKAKGELDPIKGPTPAELLEISNSAKSDVDESLEMIRELSVTTPDEMQVAGEMVKELAHRHKVLDDKRKSWVEPIKSVASDIDATFRPVLKGLKEGVEILKGKIGACQVALEQKRMELLRASVATGGKKAEALQAEAAEYIAPEIAGVGVKLRWTGEVIDAAAIPAAHRIPDVEGLEALTAALGRDPGIPGWRAFQTGDLRITKKGR